MKLLSRQTNREISGSPPSFEKIYLSPHLEYALLVLLLVLAFCARYVPSIYAEDLYPEPDAVEYALSALSLAEGSGYFIHINHLAFPTRLSFGYPLLLTPVYLIGGDRPGLAIYLSLLFGVISIIMIYVAGRLAFNSLIGLLAAAWLTFGPEHSNLSQVIMSDMASLLFFWLAVYLALIVRQPRGLFLLGLTLGYLGLIRPANIIVLPAFYLLLRPKRRQDLILVLAGLLPVLSSLFIYNWLTFGNPLKTGYVYWAPEWYSETTRTFNWSYLWNNPNRGQGNLLFYGQLLTGVTRNYYPLYLLPAGLYGLYIGRHHKFVQFSIAAICLMLAIFLLYFFQASRFLVIPGTLWLILAAYGCYELLRSLLGKTNLYNPQLFLISFLVLGIVSVIFLPWQAMITGSFLWESYVNGERRPAPAKYQIAEIIDKNIEFDAYILTRINAPYVDHYILRDTNRMHLPISRLWEDYYSRPPVQQLALPVATEQLDLLQAIIRSGRPVYLDETSCPEYPGYLRKNFQPAGSDQCAPLRQMFRLESVFELFGWHLYRLHPLSE